LHRRFSPSLYSACSDYFLAVSALSDLTHIQHRRRHSLRIEPAIEIEVLLEQDRGNGQKIDAVVDGTFEGKGLGTVARRSLPSGRQYTGYAYPGKNHVGAPTASQQARAHPENPSTPVDNKPGQYRRQ
jgi:hypothetical protein